LFWGFGFGSFAFDFVALALLAFLAFRFCLFSSCFLAFDFGSDRFLVLLF